MKGIQFGYTVIKSCSKRAIISSNFMKMTRFGFATTAKTGNKQFSANSIKPVTPLDEHEWNLNENENSNEQYYSRQDILKMIWEKKEELNLSIDDIAKELGYTNVYTGQLLLMNVPLNPSKASKFVNILDLPQECINQLVKSPHRRFDTNISQEPNTYRMIEAIQHNGEAIKLLTNEKFGDGIMSAIDFYVSVDKVIGPNNEERVEIKFNGKFLPFIEQNTEDLNKCKPQE